MTLTPIFLTGWEHGVAALNTNGGGLTTTTAGTPTSDAAAARTGTYGMLINPTAAAEWVQYATATTGIQKTSVRFYVRFPSAIPTVDLDLMVWYDSGATQLGFLTFLGASTDRFQIQSAGSSAAIIGPNPAVADTWYRVDIQLDTSGTTWTARGRIDGTTEGTSSSGSHAATDQRKLVVGFESAVTYNAHIDDFIWGTFTVASEYWGVGKVVGIVPTADGTNNPSTVVENNAGTDLGVGTTPTAFDLMDEIPMSDTTNYVQQSGAGTTNYAEVTFADIVSATAVNGARAILMYGSSSTTANIAEARIRRGDNSTDVVEVGSTVTTDINQPGTIGTPWDMSDTAAFYKGCMIPASANGTDYNLLTPTIVNALVGRVGYRSGASGGIPRWYSLMVEVDYTTVDPVAIRPPRSTMALRHASTR